MLAPSRRAIGTEQERIATPLTWTVQAPHWAMPQPNFVPVSPSSSRITQSSGACTVHVNGVAQRSCVTPVSAVEGAEITTIEGLSANGLTPVQQAWIDHQVPQCGYCQSGMIMAVSSLLKKNPHPSDDELSAAITNICRCGTYPRIRAAVRELAKV